MNWYMEIKSTIPRNCSVFEYIFIISIILSTTIIEMKEIVKWRLKSIKNAIPPTKGEIALIQEWIIEI